MTLDKKSVAHLDERERRQAQRWLGVHAWLANWDAAGFDGDNQGVLDGEVLTLDVGGALVFRAQGDPSNPHAVKLFADMSEADIRRAVEVVVRIPDERIRRVIAENGGGSALADKLLARKADMARRLTG